MLKIVTNTDKLTTTQHKHCLIDGCNNTLPSNYSTRSMSKNGAYICEAHRHLMIGEMKIVSQDKGEFDNDPSYESKLKILSLTDENMNDLSNKLHIRNDYFQ